MRVHPGRLHGNRLCLLVVDILADMRSDVQDVFAATPRAKQVMAFSVALPAEIRAVCRKLTKDVSASHTTF